MGEFSKGMQMRLNLARALVNRPRVLFLDEPTSGMDPVHASLVRDLIRRQPEQGRTVFLTTHDMATAEQLCDRVAFMVDGRIAAVDTPAQLPARPRQTTRRGRVSGTETGCGARSSRSRRIGDDPAFAALLRATPGGDHPHPGSHPRRRVRRGHRRAVVNRRGAALVLEWPWSGGTASPLSRWS